MLKKGEIRMIHKWLREGMSKSSIARRLGISRETVRKYALKPEGYVPVISRKPNENLVDEHLPYIAAMLETAKTNNYDTVSNKQLLDMMIQILDKTTESKDKNLNDVEREKETKENEEFAEGMKMRAEKVIKEKLPEKQPEIKPQQERSPQQQHSPQPRIFRRKGRNLLR